VEQFIGCDAHKKFSVFVAVDEKGRATKPMRVEHECESYRAFLNQLPEGSETAPEACGFWYWMVDEMEASMPPISASGARAICSATPWRR